MARQISFIVTNSGTINAVCNNQAYSIPPDHSNYERIKQAVIKDDPADFQIQADVKKAVEQFTAPAANTAVGKVEIVDGVVVWNGQPVHNAISDRILMLMREGFPFEPMLLFLENLMKNPSKRAVDELYKFLEHQGLPITEDGCFYGYKRVRADYTDCHTGTVSNKIGNVLEMPRNTVDDNWRELCSSGFHVGAIEYVRQFCNEPDNHVMIVKVNPADVVSVPSYENTKLRTCKYEVVAEYDKSLLVPLADTLHDTAGKPVESKRVATSCSWDELDTEEEEDEDDDYEDEDDSELDDEEDNNTIIARLVKAAKEKDVRPIELAYALDMTGYSRNCTLEQIIGDAIRDFDFTEQDIADEF